MGIKEKPFPWTRQRDTRVIRPPTEAEQPSYAEATQQDITLKQRIKQPMSTGGIALLLSATPHRFFGLGTIGKIVFIFDIVIFLALCIAITARFVLHPGTLQKSLLHPTEALFFPTFFLALVNVLTCIHAYGVPTTGSWLVVVDRVLFWLYVAMTLTVAIMQYWSLFTARVDRLTIQSMTPGWLLPVFPVMISGTYASLIASTQPPNSRMPIIVAGVTFQGLGFMVSFLMYSIYIHRLMQFGLPAPNLRPGMFIAVGAPSFTGIALIGLSLAIPEDYGYFDENPGSAMVLRTMALFVAIFLWTLSFWFFCLSAISVLTCIPKISFHLAWWAFIFPNVGFTIVTIDIGTQLKSQGILWVTSVMTVLLIAMWIFVAYSHVSAVIRKEILRPGMDEDKDQYKEDDEKHNIPIPPKHEHIT